MEEKVNQLEHLLEEISEEIESRLFIETISEVELNNTIRSFEAKGLSKDLIDSFKELIIEESSEKSTKLFYESNIPKIKAALTTMLNRLNNISFNKEERKGINSSTPNQEFKNLIEKGILTPEQEIFGTFKGQTFVGHLTKEGFFNLICQGENKLFNDFKHAAIFAWGPPIPDNGWYVWSTIDNKTKDTKPLKYFRRKLKELE